MSTGLSLGLRGIGFRIMFGMPMMYPAPVPFNAPMAAGVQSRIVRQQWQPHAEQMGGNINSVERLKGSPVGMVPSGVARPIPGSMPMTRPNSVAMNSTIAMLPAPPSFGWLPSNQAPRVTNVPNFGLRNLYQPSGGEFVLGSCSIGSMCQHSFQGIVCVTVPTIRILRCVA